MTKPVYWNQVQGHQSRSNIKVTVFPKKPKGHCGGISVSQKQLVFHDIFQAFNSLPNAKLLDWSKLKAFASDKLYLSEKLKYAFGRVKKIVGKGDQHFILFPQCSQKASFQGSLNWDCVVKS